MTRLLVPAAALAALLGFGRWDSPTVRADDQVTAGYVEEAETGGALEADSDQDAAIGEPNPLTAESDSADAASPEQADDDSGTEVIRERYPNRSVKIERDVTQDESGNYINHGSWRMWDPKGTIMIEGQCRDGEREGVWNRWYRTGEVDLLTKAPFNAYQGPFISQASFSGGKLDGKWTIYDAKHHKISEWEFVSGDRHGRSTWWYANGHKMREIEYNKGEIDGQLIEWTLDGKLVVKDTYQRGRKLASRTEKNTNGTKKTDGVYLFAKEVVRTPDDWWNATLAVYVKQGKDEKHGPWVAWFPNGQKQAEGEYRNDVQVGKFVWWYANGQKAIEGAYADGEQQGHWVWWHENGQKSIRGEYTKGHPSGRWTWWNADGKVARSTEMEQGAGEIVHLPEKPQPQPRSSARPEAMPAQPRARAIR